MKALVAAVIILGSLVGCVSMGKTGRPIRPDALSQMQIHASSQDQVRAALGEPIGIGGSRLGPGTPYQEIWFYQYMVFQIPMKSEMLLVFFEDGRYSGHFWFSGLVPASSMGH